jgi:Protein of unknown function (DUF1501)
MKTKNNLPRILSRRQFLSLSGLGTLACINSSPVDLLFRGLVDGLIADAQAQSSLTKAKNYISILFPGAPTTWVWHGFLNPNNETISKNNSVANWLVQDSYIAAPATNYSNVTYRAEQVNLPGGGSIYLPPLWNRNIPTSGGGVVAMNSLLNNTLLIRGIDMQIDLGHGVGPAKVIYPLGAAASITGLVGDASTTPIPVVGMGPHNYADPVLQGYKSLKGTSSTLIPWSNPLQATLAPFINTNAAVLAHMNQFKSAPVQTALKNSINELSAFAKSSLPGSDVLHKNADNAIKLFETTFGDLSSIYTSLYNKYYSLVQRCARTAIPNIIPTTGNGNYNLGDGNFTSEFAGQFAVAEFLLTNGLSSAICMSSDNSTGVAALYSSNDEHAEIDRQQSVISHSFQFLSLSALIYELRRVLIEKGLWSSTVIHVSGEYGRSPRNDGSGTDHGTNANAMAIFSGAITKPTFIGNVRTEGLSGTPYIGSWGIASSVVTDFGTQIITNNTTTSTLASILGIQNPISASTSLVSVDSSGVGITSLTESPRNV